MATLMYRGVELDQAEFVALLGRCESATLHTATDVYTARRWYNGGGEICKVGGQVRRPIEDGTDWIGPAEIKAVWGIHMVHSDPDQRDHDSIRFSDAVEAAAAERI